MAHPQRLLLLSGVAALGVVALSVLILFMVRASVGLLRYQVSSREAPRHAIANGQGSATLLLNPSTGATAASLTLLELGPGATVPEHTHERSTEILYLQEGAVEMTVAGQVLRAEQGDALYIPAETLHSARVVSERPLRAVQLYVRPGPEQRFTQGPRLEPQGAPP